MKTNNMRWVLKMFLVVLALGSLAACGGGQTSGSDPSTATVTATGRFVGPVTGLGYTAGSYSGTTGADSSFTYNSASTVKFYVGDILLGEAPAGSLVTPLHLVAGSDAATPQVLNVVRFLLSIGDASTQLTIPSPFRLRCPPRQRASRLISPRSPKPI